MNEVKDLREDITKKSFRSCYLLYGTEEYLKREWAKALKNALIPGENSMNFSTFSGDKVEPDAIVSMGRTLPFFAERRVIYVQDSHLFKGKAKETANLVSFLKEQISTAVLVFIEEDVDKRSALYKAIHTNGRVILFETQKGDVLLRWVRSSLQKEGRRISARTAEKFLSMTGTDMGNIYQEMEKLISYTLGRDEITDEDVEAISTKQLSDRIFDLVGAVTERRQKLAMDRYTELLELKIPPTRILYLLGRQFNLFFQVRLLLEEGMGQNELATTLRQPPWLMRKIIPLCRNYTVQQLSDIVETFVRTEEEVKTGILNDRISVEMLIIRYSAGRGIL